MKSNNRLIAILLAGVLCAGGCGKSGPAAHPSHAGGEDPATATTGDFEMSSPKGYKPADTPLAFGTLPEGVGIAVGQKAPDFSAKDGDGKTVTLAGLLATPPGPVLLVFYRGGW